MDFHGKRVLINYSKHTTYAHISRACNTVIIMKMTKEIRALHIMLQLIINKYVNKLKTRKLRDWLKANLAQRRLAVKSLDGCVSGCDVTQLRSSDLIINLSFLTNKTKILTSKRCQNSS